MSRTSNANARSNDTQKSKEHEKSSQPSKTVGASSSKGAKEPKSTSLKVYGVSKSSSNSVNEPKDSKDVIDKTDASKPSSSPPGAKAVGSSSVASASDGHGKETPPTSDAIDVDMLSDDDIRPLKAVCFSPVTQAVQFTLNRSWHLMQTRTKRKIALGDSDSDNVGVKAESTSARPISEAERVSPPPRKGM